MQTDDAGPINRPVNQHSQEHDDESISVHCDGAGCRPDGKGSGFGWIQPKTRQQHVERIDGLTNNQAEYRALISALNAIPDGSTAHILTDSQLMWSQFIGAYNVRDPELAELLSQVRTLIKEKKLTIVLQWVPRERNLAGKLLKRAGPFLER
jgi:ribonuclease HI